MFDNQLTIRDRLEDILESINLIQEWSKGRTTVDDFTTRGDSPLVRYDNQNLTQNPCVRFFFKKFGRSSYFPQPVMTSSLIRLTISRWMFLAMRCIYCV